MQIGDKIIVTGKLVRKHTDIRYRNRCWIFEKFNKKKEAIYLGTRTLTNGSLEADSDDAFVYNAYETIKAVLFKTLDNKTNPQYCPQDSIDQ